MESRKIVLKNLLARQHRETNIENKFMNMGRGKKRVRCMERVTETYITICKIDRQWEFAVCLRKLKQGLCINTEG